MHLQTSFLFISQRNAYLIMGEDSHLVYIVPFICIEYILFYII